jgi:hypothetical protein
MDLAKTNRPALDDTGISQDAPYVRALIALRLEQLWQQVNGHITARNDAEMEPDVRMVEAGVRILKAQTGLYRLDAPTGSPEELVGGLNVDSVGLALAGLEQLEARMSQDQDPKAS